MRPLPASFFRRPADLVARELLGATIVSTIAGVRTSGIIVETEAYLGFDDPAAHAYRGRRHAGNLSLYGAPGTWYVYRSYGVHWCMNLVCDGPAEGSAVLLRGLRPGEGLEAMRARRGVRTDKRLADGPGKLTQALAVDRALDGVAMYRSAVLVGPGERLEFEVTPRIGITKAADWPLRFFSRG